MGGGAATVRRACATCSLSGGMGEAGHRNPMVMFKRQRRFKALRGVLPFSLVKRFIRGAVPTKRADRLTPEEKAVMAYAAEAMTGRAMQLAGSTYSPSIRMGTTYTPSGRR